MNPIPILQKLLIALDGEFPILEFLFIIHQYYRPWPNHNPSLKLPETFRAPHLRQLIMVNFAIPIGSPILMNMGNLVTLFLNQIPSSAYFHPNALLQRLSLMPQLENLGIFFKSYHPFRDMKQQLLRTSITTHVTLPNLRRIGFRGTSAYFVALLPWVTIPLLEKLQLYFFNQVVYIIPHLQQTMNTAGNLRFGTATFSFRKDNLNVKAYPRKGTKIYTLGMVLGGKHLDWQVLSAAQVFCAPTNVFSAVEHLTLKSSRHGISSEWNNEADRTRWREFLGSFVNVKTLHVNSGFIKQISRALQHDEGESPTEPLPKLKKLSYYRRHTSRNAFASFIDARRKAGRTVSIVRIRV